MIFNEDYHRRIIDIVEENKAEIHLMYDEELLPMVEKGISQAKRDLSTGIQYNELDEMLFSNMITATQHKKGVNAIRVLETFIELWGPWVNKLTQEIEELKGQILQKPKKILSKEIIEEYKELLCYAEQYLCQISGKIKYETAEETLEAVDRECDFHGNESLEEIKAIIDEWVEKNVENQPDPETYLIDRDYPKAIKYFKTEIEKYEIQQINDFSPVDELIDAELIVTNVITVEKTVEKRMIDVSKLTFNYEKYLDKNNELYGIEKKENKKIRIEIINKSKWESIRPLELDIDKKKNKEQKEKCDRNNLLDNLTLKEDNNKRKMNYNIKSIFSNYFIFCEWSESTETIATSISEIATLIVDLDKTKKKTRADVYEKFKKQYDEILSYRKNRDVDYVTFVKISRSIVNKLNKIVPEEKFINRKTKTTSFIADVILKKPSLYKKYALCWFWMIKLIPYILLIIGVLFKEVLHNIDDGIFVGYLLRDIILGVLKFLIIRRYVYNKKRLIIYIVLTSIPFIIAIASILLWITV